MCIRDRFFTVSSFTVLSRILGFIRDILIAKYLGSTVSSTKIRNLLSLGLSVSGLVHPKVEEIILKRNLHGGIRS